MSKQISAGESLIIRHVTGTAGHPKERNLPRSPATRETKTGAAHMASAARPRQNQARSSGTSKYPYLEDPSCHFGTLWLFACGALNLVPEFLSFRGRYHLHRLAPSNYSLGLGEYHSTVFSVVGLLDFHIFVVITHVLLCCPHGSWMGSLQDLENCRRPKQNHRLAASRDCHFRACLLLC